MLVVFEVQVTRIAKVFEPNQAKVLLRRPVIGTHSWPPPRDRKKC